MRLKLMSDVQYLSPKRAVKVRDESFLLGVRVFLLYETLLVSIKHLEENSDHAPLQLFLVTSIGHRTSV